jgi:DNA polymerase-3 subunit beta
MKNLKKLAGATLEKSNTLPILDCVLIEKGNLTFSDLKTTLIVKDFIPDKNINICVDAKDFCEIKDLVEKEKALLTYKQNGIKLILSTENENFTLTALETPDEYPRTVECKKREGTLTGNDIVKIKKCSLFADNNDMRPVMSGVFIDKNKVVGTDAHILHWNNLEGKVKTPFNVPKKAIDLLDILNPEKVQIFSQTDKRKIITTIRFVFGNIEIIARAIEGKYPNWEAVLSTDFAGAIIFDKKEMLQTIAKGKKFANQVTQQMIFNINGKGYKTTFCDVDRGTEYLKKFAGGIRGDVDNFGLNAAMLEKILKTIPEDEITINFSAPNRGMRVNNNYLLMPVMIDA